MKNTLLVVANPDYLSLTQRVVERFREEFPVGKLAIADLAAEGFDPRTSISDRRAYQGVAPLPQDVIDEQRRVDEADHLVFIFPVYWWSMPALLKGWVERVFTHGWAFGSPSGDSVPRNLRRLMIHMVPIAASSNVSFEEKGYREAFRTQIESGIFSYCGAQQGVTAFIYESEGRDREATKINLDKAVDSVLNEVLDGVTG